MHGTLPRAWTVLDGGVAELDGASDAFPFAHTVRWRSMFGDALRITTTIEAHDEPMPVSFGFHPFLLIPGVPRRAWHVHLMVNGRFKLSDQQIPTGETESVEPYDGPLGNRAYNDGYSQLADGPFVVEGGDRRIEVDFEEGFPFAQVFAPPANDLISFEPMTAPTDALRSAASRWRSPGSPTARSSRSSCTSVASSRGLLVAAARLRAVNHQQLAVGAADLQRRSRAHSRTSGWRCCWRAVVLLRTSWRAHRRRNWGLFKDSSPTSSVRRASSRSVPTLARSAAAVSARTRSMST